MMRPAKLLQGVARPRRSVDHAAHIRCVLTLWPGGAGRSVTRSGPLASPDWTLAVIHGTHWAEAYHADKRGQRYEGGHVVPEKVSGQTKTDKDVLQDPRCAKRVDYAQRIEVAKRAREAGQAIRIGKAPIAADPRLISR